MQGCKMISLREPYWFDVKNLCSLCASCIETRSWLLLHSAEAIPSPDHTRHGGGHNVHFVTDLPAPVAVTMCMMITAFSLRLGCFSLVKMCPDSFLLSPPHPLHLVFRHDLASDLPFHFRATALQGVFHEHSTESLSMLWPFCFDSVLYFPPPHSQLEIGIFKE